MLDPIALAVPFFFLLIAIELVVALRRKMKVYRFADALTNLSCGITSQIVLLLWAALLLAIYEGVYRRAHLIEMRGWVPWVVAFVGVDFLYYWWHRLSHEVNVLWAAHVVHHQSEDYNLAVALRQAVLTSWTALPFYLPLAVLGVPTHVYAIVHALSTLYQFWIHTELVGRVRGPLDWILNLPSHHRVHHAINPQYLDKNYGATLIIWDRLFGTYAIEEERCVYGITKPLGSFNPMWAQIHYWFEMRDMMRAAKTPLEKLRVWIASPAWKPAGYTVTTPPIQAREKFDRPLSPRLVRYIAVQYVIVIVVTFGIMSFHSRVNALPLALAGLAVLLTLVVVGALLEGRRWALIAEGSRIAIGLAAVAAFVA